MESRTFRLLVVDDFASFRATTRELLQAHSEWNVVGEACNGLEAVQKVTTLRPDVVLLDIGMPKMNGIEAAKRISSEDPNVRIIFLTQDGGEATRVAALAAGGCAVVLKANAARELVPAIIAALGMGNTRSL